MTKLRLDDLKAALEQRRPPAAKSEADYKRELVADINRLPGGRARRIEDRYGTGILDLIIKLPDMPLVMAEGKLIEGVSSLRQAHNSRKASSGKPRGSTVF